MSIRDWPVNERPREKLLANGAHSLSDAKLLAVLLRGSGQRDLDAVAMARELRRRHQSLRGLLSAPRASGATSAGSPLDSPQATRDYLIRRLRDTPHELFCCLHLDNRHRLIAFDELFRGTIVGASVHPREVVKQALARNAAAVILAHNHPSGVAEPSQADELVTRRLREALQLVDIRVLDHMIVADNGCLSFAEHGLM